MIHLAVSIQPDRQKQGHNIYHANIVSCGKNASRDLGHAPFGVFVTHRLVFVMIYLRNKLEVDIFTLSKDAKEEPGGSPI